MDKLFNQLAYLAEQGVIRQLDYQFSRFIGSLLVSSSLSQFSEQDQKAQVLLAATLSAALGKGNIGLPLLAESTAKFDQQLGLTSTLALEQESLVQWQSLWTKTDWQSLAQYSPVLGHAGRLTPLVLEGERAYLYRYWDYELRLAHHLLRLSHSESLKPMASQKLKDNLDFVFATRANSTLDWQKVAVAVALLRQFTVISGGPGTGKTTTVTQLLAALVLQAQQAGQALRIQLVAPTGKAAARLTESLGRALANSELAAELKAAIPTQASTIHRLLEVKKQGTQFGYHAQRRLALDVLVVDEASMVDMALMVHLLDALSDHAHLIFLGDKDQLASVEAGAVLGDICSFLEQGYSQQQALLLEQLTGYEAAHFIKNTPSNAISLVANSLCQLNVSYRFNAQSGIGQLAKAVNEADVATVNAVLAQSWQDVSFFSLTSSHHESVLAQIVAGYQHYLTVMTQPVSEYTSVEQKAAQVLQAFNQYRVLCALRENEFGVSGLNSQIEQALKKQGYLVHEEETWYAGRPVLITRNDYGLALYNGDVGICLWDEQQPARLKVYFELPDGRIKAVLPNAVPEHETAYAMTIHKSQGSEFNAVCLILPPQPAQVLTKELVYTGITRAKQHLLLYANEAILHQAVTTKIQRASGLVQRLS